MYPEQTDCRGCVANHTQCADCLRFDSSAPAIEGRGLTVREFQEPIKRLDGMFCLIEGD